MESGCWLEAQRADLVARNINQLRNALDLEFSEHTTALLRQVEATSRFLRDLYDLFPIYHTRVAILTYYLQVLLPCLQKTLRDMRVYVDNKGLQPIQQWKLMTERLAEQGGMTVIQRFVLYNEFLVQLIRLLSRSPLYDPTSLELLRIRVLQLRQLRGLPAPPLALRSPIAAVPQAPLDPEQRHWAEKIFEDNPKSVTGLSHRRESKCFGPPMSDVVLGLSPQSVVLFKLPFDKNHLSITVYLQSDTPDVTRVLCRWIDSQLNPRYSCYGINELCIRRKGSSLQLKRWSEFHEHPMCWTALFFKTWEKMVLFHCAFVALKARCPLTKVMHPEDFAVVGETRLFQGRIIDDGYEHSLAVYQDEKSGGLRLHAAAWSGELKRCPVWTAFVTHQSASSQWMVRRSKHRIWLKEIYPFVFCKDYKKRHQVKKNGEFELYFCDAHAADAFEDVFGDPSENGDVIEVNAVTK
ncbi:hypothetical protein F5884DRAFT_366070 [Xylogone sp. PMI_703]|nr:hypothetical protein F5884DRAFT_366070 [Xylogone sp. PMI_703]